MKEDLELILYYGKTQTSDYLPEGPLELGKDGQSSINYGKALGIVDRYLLQDFRSIEIIGRLVQTEEEAQRLIEYIKEKFPGSGEGVRLHSCVHARIRFFRTVVVNGIGEEEKDKLVEILNESGLLNIEKRLVDINNLLIKNWTYVKS